MKHLLVIALLLSGCASQMEMTKHKLILVKKDMGFNKYLGPSVDDVNKVTQIVMDLMYLTDPINFDPIIVSWLMDTQQWRLHVMKESFPCGADSGKCLGMTRATSIQFVHHEEIGCTSLAHELIHMMLLWVYKNPNARHDDLRFFVAENSVEKQAKKYLGCKDPEYAWR